MIYVTDHLSQIPNADTDVLETFGEQTDRQTDRQADYSVFLPNCYLSWEYKRKSSAGDTNNIRAEYSIVIPATVTSVC